VTLSVRRLTFAAGAAGLAALFLTALAGLPDFGEYRGPYGDVLNRVAVSDRHTTEVVTAVVFDYRGVDTMGEEAILFAAAIGLAVLLRVTREEHEEPPHATLGREWPASSEAVRLIGRILVGPVVVVGLYVVAHGHLTPGGGFQGGAVLAAGSALAYLTGTYLTFRRVSPIPTVELAEGAAISAFPAVGLLGLVAGSAFLQDVLPLGTTGDLLSGGTIPVIDVAVGLAVAAGMVLILAEFLEQALAVREGRGR
jgi:multicomponent Na+:H+ antiporter subunit B